MAESSSYEIVLVNRQQESGSSRLATQECQNMHAEGPHPPPLTFIQYSLQANATSMAESSAG